MTRIMQIIADCFICGHPIFLRHLRSIFNFKQSLRNTLIRFQLDHPAAFSHSGVPPGITVQKDYYL